MDRNTVVGIIGDGQLARMLVEAAERRSICTLVLTRQDGSPVSHLQASHCETTRSLDEVLRRASVVLFENEFQDTVHLKKTAQDEGRDPDQLFLPNLSAIALIQDKLQQKRLCQNLGIATSPFMEQPNDVRDLPRLFEWARKAQVAFENGVVFKWSRLGYDGKGVLAVESEEKISESDTRFTRFFSEAFNKRIPIYAEQLIRFRSECALVCAHSDNVQRYFPLFLTKQANGICETVLGPATSFGISDRDNKDAQTAAKKISEHLDLQGVFAIEFFISESDELLVNEIAPRVHNSGHITQDAFNHSQFDLQVLSALGKLHESSVQKAKAPLYGMKNILGTTSTALSSQNTFSLPAEHGALHWYDKSECRPGRKLGHVNVLASSKEELEGKLDFLDRTIEKWRMSLGDS